MVETDLAGPITSDPPGIAVELGWLGPEHAAAYAAHHPDATPATLGERVAAGDRCLAAWRDGIIVSSRWHAIAAFREDWLPFRFGLDADEIYLYGAYTDEAYRGQGVAVTVRVAAARELAAEGRRRLVSVVYAANGPGLRSAALSGGRARGRMLVRGRVALLLRPGRLPRVARARSSRQRWEHVPAVPSFDA